MTDNAETARLSEKLAVLEERMNTMNERYDKGWALLREDMAKRDADTARRETANTRWVVGSIAVAAVFIVAVLGVLIRLPPPG